jgi:guanylate kinase
MNNHRFKSQIIVFSAPSGAGKTTLIARLREKYPELCLSVSATTRPIRPGETEGQAYYFLDGAAFIKKIEEDAFIEYEQVHGNYYGTLKSKVRDALDEGQTILFDIDVNGARSIRRLYPQAILIFILPPDQDTLINRLQSRKSENDQTMATRLERIQYEYSQKIIFDYVVVNDQLEDALHQIESIILR